MKSQSRSCYLIDTDSFVNLVATLDPQQSGLETTYYGNLNAAARAVKDAQVDLHLFGEAGYRQQAGDALGIFAATGLHEEVTGLPRLADWLKKHARERRSTVQYILVSNEGAVRDMGKMLGLSLMGGREFIQFWQRRLAPFRGKAQESDKEGQLRIRKGGGQISGQELQYWKESFGLEADDIGKDLERSQESGDGEASGRSGKGDDLFNRHLGVTDNDSRLMEQEDDDWLDEES